MILGTASVSFGADSLTAGVTISGTVAARTAISVAASTFSTLDIRAGASWELVATATEICNANGGYKVALKSANAAAAADDARNVATLKGTAHAANKVTYTIKYNDTAVVLDAATDETTTEAPAFSTASPSAEAGVGHTIKVNFTGVYMPADTYSDLLTLTIAAN